MLCVAYVVKVDVVERAFRVPAPWPLFLSFFNGLFYLGYFRFRLYTVRWLRAIQLQIYHFLFHLPFFSRLFKFLLPFVLVFEVE
jgi:hypothetical protein